MSDSSILREFLVSLGFKVDEAGYKKFTQGLDAATKAASKMATELLALEAGIVALVTKTAASFEDLYFASQRLNSSVENIKAFGFAISQVGGNAAGARGSLEGLASFMRSNPSGERFIASLGVSTRDANGNLRDTADIMRDLGVRFAQMPYYIAKIRAQLLGIDETTLQALIRGTAQGEDRFKALAERAGMSADDLQRASKAAHDFMSDIRDLGAYLELLAGKYLLGLMGPIEQVISGLESLDQATGGASTALIALAAVLGPLLFVLDPIVVGIAAMGAALIALWSDFENWKQGSASFIDWAQWSDQIDKVIAAFQPFMEALKELADFVAKWGAVAIRYLGPATMDIIHGAITEITDSIRLLGDAILVIVDLLTGHWSKAWTDAGKAAKDVVSTLVDQVRTPLKVLSDLWYAATHHGEAPPNSNVAPTGPSAQARARALAGGAAPGVGAGAAAEAIMSKVVPMTSAMSSVGSKALAYFMSQGWSRAQATGIVSNLQSESGLNPSRIGDHGQAYGVAQWHPDRQRAFAQWAGHDIRQSSLAEQLAFAQHELTQGAFKAVGDRLRGITDAAQAGALVSRDFERPRDVFGAMAARARLAQQWFSNPGARTQGSGNGGATISQETNINVYGSSDPHATARETVAAQSRVNADLLRNTQSALA